MACTFARRWLRHFLREWQHLVSDRWLFCTVTVLPIVLFATMASVFQAGIARDLGVAVVDLDNSALSRNLVRTYDASPVLSMVAYPTVQAAAHSVRGGDSYAMVVIPAGMARSVKRQESPVVTAFYNGQYVLIAKLVSSALKKAHATFAARIDLGKAMFSGQEVFQSALAQASPVSTQVTALFNNSSNYAIFLVPAIIPALWQILMIAGGVLAVDSEQRDQGLQHWLQGGVWPALLGKLAVYQIIFALLGAGYLAWFYQVQGWPMHGSWFVLLLAQNLTILACLSVATFIALMTEDAARGFSMAAAYTAPCFAFMGITFPVTDMPVLAQLWRAMLPVSHYLELQIGQANYGESLSQAGTQLLALLVFVVFLVLAACKGGIIVRRSGRMYVSSQEVQV